MKPIVYAFPGLGTDRRMFGLQLGLNCELRIPDWIPPKKDESMNQYASRMAKTLDTSRPFSIMGVSLGGMMCMEIAKYVQPEKIMLISSCKTRSELPPHIRFAKSLGGATLMPVPAMRRAIQSWSRLLSDLPESQKRVFDNMVMNVDGDFLIWAATAITRWKNETIHDNIIHIHGNDDKVLPFKYVQEDIVVEGGTHYMCASKADEVNELIDKYLLEACPLPQPILVPHKMPITV